MNYLPNDINVLRDLLKKKREDLAKAKIRYQYFMDQQKLELYDTFIAEPLEKAKAKNEPKEEQEKIKQMGLVRFNEQLLKDKNQILTAVKLGQIKTDIKNIKNKILEIDPESLDELMQPKSDGIRKAQNRFELSVN